MWGAALALLWALSVGTLALRDGYTTADSMEAFYSEDEGQSLIFPGASNKLWLPGLHEPVTHHHEREDKRGDCIEGEECPVCREGGMACVHHNCSNHSECEGALKCCRTLCGKRCMLPEFKLPCGSDHNCPASTSCCYDGSCDSDCPIPPTTSISQQYSTALPTVEGSGDHPSSVHSLTHNQNDSQSTTEEINQPHSPTEESSNAFTTNEDGNYHK
ncbi:hypothetical protein NDU88_000737 [Pleurodeles waltl]|uniref:WAP domain-containing protein n=1 Tax=Pleurodeles waltl TaxID=8319 RepID=A0AAV7P1S1_PLEWA|nr:hypothetical protein NDU88_000737 [Pleurodeles waltl]